MPVRINNTPESVAFGALDHIDQERHANQQVGGGRQRIAPATVGARAVGLPDAEPVDGRHRQPDKCDRGETATGDQRLATSRSRPGPSTRRPGK